MDLHKKLESIKLQVEKLAKIIQAPDNLLPTYGNWKESHPNIEISDKGSLTFEIYERGQPIHVEYAIDVDHLLYLIFSHITLSISIDYVSKNPEPDISYNRSLNNHQLLLLGKLKKEWQQKAKEYQDRITLQHPLDDYEGKKRSYFRELLGNGFLYHEAIKKVKAKYP